MATGDILSVTILPEGWQAQVVFSGLTKYAAFDNGLGGPYLNDPDPTATPPGAPKLTLNVTSLGFDANGNATTVARKVYGTIPIRNTFTINSDQNFQNQTTDGSNLTVIFALSDNIYAKDDVGLGKSGTAVTANISANFINGVPFYIASGAVIYVGTNSAQTKAISTYFGDIAVPANQVFSMGGINWTFPNTITQLTSRIKCANNITTSGTYTLSAINTNSTLKAGQVYGTDGNGFNFTVASDIVVSTTGTPVTITVTIGSYTANTLIGSSVTLTPSGTTLFNVTTADAINIPNLQVSNVATNMTVINNSSYDYSGAIGNWSCMPNRLLALNEKLRVIAFSHSGHDGKPCACVKVTVTDQHAHTETVTVTDMSIDSSMSDASPVSEYIAQMSLSTMTLGDILTTNFKAYPWVGDTNAILDTSRTATPGLPIGTVEPTPHAGPKTHIYDPSGTYNPYVAVVDPTLGSDVSGSAQLSLGLAATTPFATIAGAIGLLVGSSGLFKKTKDNLGRNNIGGANIYLRTGNHAWMGGTPYATGVTAPNVWLNIQKYPGESPIISSQSGGTWWGASVNTKIKFSGLTWQIGGSTIIFSSSFTSMVWFDQCTMNMTYSASMYIMGFAAYTRCLLISANVGYGGNPAQVLLCRGNTVAPTPGSQAGWAQGINVIGNKKTTPTNYGLGVNGYSPTNLYCASTLSKVGTGSGTVNMLLSAASPSIITPGSPIWLRTAGSPLPIVGYVPVSGSVTLPTWPASVPVTVDFRPTNGSTDILYDIPAWNGIASNQAGQGSFVGSAYSITEYSSNAIIAYNQWKSANYGGLMCNFFQGAGPELWGSALVQNTLESLYGSNPCLQFGADSTFLSPLDNLLIWHNTVLGNRCNGPYNTVDDAPAWRRKWSFKNNAFDGLNLKADLFGGESVSTKNNVSITGSGLQTINLFSPNGYNVDLIRGSTLTFSTTFSATLQANITVGTDSSSAGGTPTSINVTLLSSTVPPSSSLTASGESHTRVGNWSQYYGVNNEGIYNPQVQQLKDFPRAWIGLRGYQASNSPPKYFVFRRRATHRNTSYVTLGTQIVAADVGNLKTVSLYTLSPSVASDSRVSSGIETFVAGDHLSISNVVSGITQLDIVFQGPVTITSSPQSVTVRVLSAPATTPIGTTLCYEYLGDIRCDTTVNSGASPTTLNLRVPYGTLALTDGMLLTGGDGSLQVTVNAGQGIILNQIAQAVAVTTVTQQSTGTTARNLIAGEYIFSPTALANWGGGDYHPNVGSPLLVGSRAQLLPFDITGTPRPVGFQISGAYIANITTGECTGD